MPLTAQCRRLLDRFEQLGVLPYDQLSVLQAREVVSASRPLQGEPVDLPLVEDVLAPGSCGELPVRIYDPAPGTCLPLVVYFHGGGWVTGSVDIADTPCRALAAATQCVVASVEYRLSPETKYPGPAEDCYAATQWLASTCRRWDADPRRLVVCGDSAGGNLAAAVTLMTRDRGGAPITAQVLLYPPLAPGDGSEFPSHRENAEGYGLTSGSMEWFWSHYLRSPEDGRRPYAAPLRAPDLSGLPSALVVTAEYDPLRDEGIAYAERLRADGVDVHCISYDGLIHGFFWMAKPLDEGREVLHSVAGWLGTALG